MSCDKCDEPSVAIWPAFDRKVEPKPYCSRHLDEAKRDIILEGPHFPSMAKPKRELVAV